jgi:D-alanyl-D-alanine carboxypeptidase/D-alanyl-D-alanine-endopeptidase (penicillin-binding protein 4)
MSRKLLLFGAAVVAAGVLLKRDKVAGLLPGRGQTYEPPAPHQPGPSNYDAPGPVAITATPVPAPEPQEPEAIDEAHEEAAAAAEAANIGGVVSDYAGPADEPATEAERPVAEAGGGEAEGQEQTEAELREAAQPADGISDEQRQIEEAIDQQANPLAGEQVEGLFAPDDTARDSEPLPPADPPPAEPPRTETESSAWSPPVPERTDEPAPFDAASSEPSEPSEPAQYEPPTQEQPAVPPQESDEEKKDDEDGGSDWRTWSGRSVNP